MIRVQRASISLLTSRRDTRKPRENRKRREMIKKKKKKLNVNTGACRVQLERQKSSAAKPIIQSEVSAIIFRQIKINLSGSSRTFHFGRYCDWSRGGEHEEFKGNQPRL